MAPGITRVSTAGHGGYHVEAAAVRAMPPGLAAFDTFAGGDGRGGQWFEEDEDWSVVALSFPHLFAAYDVWCALRTFECCARTLPRYAAARDAFTGAGRAEVERIASAWFDEHRDHWRLQGYGTGTGSGWIVHYAHLTSGETASREVSAAEFRGLGPAVAVLPGVAFLSAPRGTCAATGAPPPC